MGGKSGGQAYTPVEHPDNLQSAQIAEIIDLLGEGEIAQELDLKRIYLNDTPVQNADGTNNFQGVEFVANKGTRDQLPLAGFENTLRTVQVGARVKKTEAIVREVTDPTVTGLILTLGVSALARTTDQGDRLTTSVSMLVEFVKNGASVYQERVTFEGKTTSQYYADDVYEQLPQVPFSIRVSRVDNDSTSERLQNDTYFVAYTEVINAKLSYPHSVVVGIKADSAQFGNQIPTRKYLVKGLVINVPDNYDPETRTYTGIWSGAFKPAWTNNPAWVFYDAVTNDRYGLGDKISGFECDKWALYQIARYCDEMVDDGYGGKEPRMTCNLHITDQREGYEVLSDLASIFRGISMWTGNVLTVANDRVTEPVAIYTNANVVDGLFSRSFVAKRAMTSVVHVSYMDKREMYRQKTEYVSDDELVKRYGENVKSVVAYGCTSRGQAARLGRWIIETSKRERQTITFTVGREGLRHLPFDVIQVSDKYWANEMVGGRVAAVSGKNVTLDVEVKNAVGGTLIYMGASGQVTQNITGLSADKKTVTLAANPTGLAVGDVWSMIPSTGIKPQLFRCLSIEENSDAGTYTVTAVVHDPDKNAMVDKGVKFTTGGRTSNYTLKPEVYNPNVIINGNAMTLTFDSNISGGNVEYEFTVYRDGKIVRAPVLQKSPEFVLSGLGNGSYIVKARAKGDYGYSNYLEYGFTVDFNVTGLRATPKTLAIDLAWDWPDTVVSKIAAQIWYATVDNVSQASLLATVPYPQNTYTMSGVGVADTFYFWARGVSEAGDYGELTPSVKGRADNDPAPIIAQIQGAITKSALSQALIEQLNNDAAGAVSDAVAEEAKQRAKALQAEADARTKAIQAEQSARVAAVKAAADKASGELLAKANELGTRITNTENTNKTQSQQISTVTAAQGQTAAGLEQEKTARINGDNAEARARETLAARVGTAEGAINTERNARIEGDRVTTEQLNTLKSRTDKAEGNISQLQTTVADNNRARAEESKELKALFDGLSVGGRNYLFGTGYLNNYGAFSSGYLNERDETGLFKVTNNNASNTNISIATRVKSTHTIKAGTQLVVSYDYKTNANNLNYTYLLTDDGNIAIGKPEVNVIGDGEWHRAVFKYVPIKDLINPRFLAGVYRANSGEYLSIKNAKLEIGSIPTDWTPAPEDAESKANANEAALNEYKSAQAAAATAEATRLTQAIARVGAAEGEIRNLKQTSITRSDATSIASDAVNAKFQVKDTRNDNHPPTWYWTNYPRQTASELKLVSAMGLGTSGFATLETVVPWINGSGGAITQTAYLQNGVVMRRKSDVAYTYNASSGYTYTKDLWTAWVADETVTGAQAKADAVKKIADAANALATQTDADFKQFVKTNSTATTATAEKLEQLSAKLGAAGNRNLLRATAKMTDTKYWRFSKSGSQTNAEHARQDMLLTLKLANNAYAAYIQRETENPLLAFKGGETLTLSFDVRCTTSINESIKLWAREYLTNGGNNGSATRSKRTKVKTVDKWERIEWTFTLADNHADHRNWEFWIEHQAADSTMEIKNIKLEYGEIATPWREAMEDIVDGVQSQINTVDADYQSFKSVQASKDEAETKRVDTALSRIGTAESKLTTTTQTITNLNGKVQSMYTLKAETLSGGRKAVSALMVGADGQTADSQILLMADKVAFVQPNTKAITPMMTVTRDGMALNGNLVADGTILGRHIAANQTVEAPKINGGVVTAANFNGGSINIGNGNFIVDSNGNLTARNGRFEGTIRADRIEGDVLKMKRMEHVGEGAYHIYVPAAQIGLSASIMDLSFLTEHRRESVWVKIIFNGNVIFERDFFSIFSHTEKTGRGEHDVYRGLFYTVPYVLYILPGQSLDLRIEISYENNLRRAPRNLDFPPSLFLSRY